MTAIVCDICRKPVAGAIRDVNYVSILDKDLCMPCREEVLRVTREQTLPRHPYLLKDYQDTLARNLSKMSGK
jgi:hypothetical protein